MLKKLRIKFIIINMLIVTVMLCAVFGFVYHFTRQSLESESISMMQSIAENPLYLMDINEQNPGIRLPYFVLQLNSRGNLIAAGGGYYDLSDKDFLKELLHRVLVSENSVGIISEYNLRFYRTAAGGGVSIVFADITSEKSALLSLLRILLLIGGGAFLIFFGISVALAHWAIRPVDKAWQQQRQFIADASHELKTPLTVIMTNAELLQSPDYDEESRSGFVNSILVMSKQMRGLVEQLLELARADNGQNLPPFSRLDFSSVIKNAVLPFEPVFFEKGIELSSDVEDGIFVNGDSEHLRQAAEIFLDNAQKYSSVPGKTVVCLKRSGKSRCRLSVSNTGDAIPPEELKNIFKRFYRVDKARSRNGSFGLGLSIAESVIKRHRGKIWAESKNGMNTFFAELPTA